MQVNTCMSRTIVSRPVVGGRGRSMMGRGWTPMRLQQLVRTWLLVAGTSSRLAKIEHLATLLRETTPQEIEIAIAYLSGSVRQAKLGVGWATVQAARVEPAETAGLRILEVDE